jgi:hypothetical protein
MSGFLKLPKDNRFSQIFHILTAGPETTYMALIYDTGPTYEDNICQNIVILLSSPE